MAGVVIVGAGQAGYQAAEALRNQGYDKPITLIGEEPYLPYQRPPLSKAYLLGKADAERIRFRNQEHYDKQSIDVKLRQQVTDLNVEAKTVLLSDGSTLDYDDLILATGARVRQIPVPGADLDGVVYLKTLDDTNDIQQRLEQANRVVVIGAGFIGLEFAAVARSLGKEVTVIEAMDRVMARVVSPTISEFFTSKHQSNGVDIQTNAQVAEIQGVDGKVTGVKTANGDLFNADLVLVGIGVIANTELAEQAGLVCDNGIVVDGHGRTGNGHIYACGDCVSYEHPFAGARIRLESVQNASDQARIVAANIVGQDKLYDTVPWFWSDQYDLKLQIVGLSAGCDQTVVRGDQSTEKFSVYYFRQGELRAIDSINHPADHVLGRKLLAASVGVTPEQAADTEFNLKDLLNT
jgi:3-phenylpropionate/trans-cinnamate dioxygenase ferredoxin reductase subunit